MAVDKLKIKKFRAIFPTLFLVLSFFYAQVFSINEQETVVNEVSQISKGLPEESQLIELYTRGENVRLRIKIEGISREADDYKSKRIVYMEMIKNYVCSSESFQVYLNKGTPIIVDLLATDYASSQFANMRILRSRCS